MGMFGNAFTRSLTPTANALAQYAPLAAKNGGAGSVRDPVPNQRRQQARSYVRNPAETLGDVLATAFRATGQMPGEARRTADLAVGVSPVGAANDFNSGALQTRRGLLQGSRGETLGGVLGMALAVAPVPKPVKKVLGPWERAELFKKRLAELGEAVGDISFSTNRFGQKSAYMPFGRGELRFSDHDANMDFRPGQTNVFSDDPDDWLKKHKEAVARNDAEHAAKVAAFAAADRQAKEQARAAARKEREVIKSAQSEREAYFASNGIDIAGLRGPERAAAQAGLLQHMIAKGYEPRPGGGWQIARRRR